MTAYALDPAEGPVLGGWIAPGVRYEPVLDDRHRSAAAWPALKAWLDNLALANYAARTIDRYERTCAILLRQWPTMAFEEFTDAELAHTMMTFPAKSRVTYVSALNGWFKWGRKTRRIESNPTDLLPSIRYHEPTVTPVFTDTDVTALCGLPSPDGELMTILFWSGLRRAEARHLTAKRLDLKAQMILVKEGAKGSKDREVPMFEGVPQAVASLFLLEGLGPDDFVWYTRPGGRARVLNHSHALVSTSFQVWWNRCLKNADVPYLKPHAARHTFARRLRRDGVQIEDIQFLLGHSDPKTTLKYARTTVDQVAERVRAAISK